MKLRPVVALLTNVGLAGSALAQNHGPQGGPHERASGPPGTPATTLAPVFRFPSAADGPEVHISQVNISPTGLN
ncbi:MAG: hypothetical protein KDA05_04115, partial [Phycisphaerales bacterium]|nr:hypothetical protein [Phycisphaerales bacterium]